MAEKKLKPKVVTVGAPEWMATYSDMMSLLLCFFILLFSVAEEKQEKVFEVIMGFQQYFQNKGKRLGYYPKKITLREIPGFLQNAVRPPSKTGSLGKSSSKRELLERIDQYASIYKEDNHQVVVIPGLVLFERGKSKLREDAAPTLTRVARALRKRANTDIKVVGHTSSWPLGPDADAPDHLTLGFQRAAAVNRFLSLNEELRGGTNLASQGSNSPNPSRNNLWDNPEEDDRVEILFLPAYDVD